MPFTAMGYVSYAIIVFIAVLHTSYSAKNCTAGQFLNGTVCSSCPPGQFQDHPTTQNTCKECPKGYFQNETGQVSCKPCGPGTQQLYPGGISCQYCPAGYYNNITASQTCFPCPPGSHQPEYGRTSCEVCPPGMYQDKKSQVTCMKCQQGFYQPDRNATKCRPCSGITDVLLGATKCLNCSLGQEVSTNITCVDCPAGRYRNNTSERSCVDCPKGTYSNSSGTVTCTPCMSGTYQNLTGQYTCLKCKAGTFSNTSTSKECMKCGAGFYQPLEGQVQCLRCQKGFYQAETKAERCITCPKNTNSSTTGASRCTPLCNTGSYSATGLQPCKPCPEGAYSDEMGLTECKSCPYPTIAPNLGSSDCVQCNVTYCNFNGTCRRCSETCSPGEELFYGRCVPCTPGYYRSPNSDPVCSPCPSELFCLAKNCSMCVSCYTLKEPKPKECKKTIIRTLDIVIIAICGALTFTSLCCCGFVLCRYKRQRRKVRTVPVLPTKDKSKVHPTRNTLIISIRTQEREISF